MKALIIYHANCLDGFTSAWIAEAALSQAMDTELFAGIYNTAPPYDLIDEQTQVYIVDFSYPREELHNIADMAHSVVLLDHHKSAFDRLAGFHHPKAQVILQADKSGAGLCWTFFNGTKAMPRLVAHVQDRDLWLFKLADTKAITEAMYARPFELEAWDDMASMEIQELVAEGDILFKKKMTEIEAWIKEPLTHSIGGYHVPTVNVPAAYSSEAGHAMCNAFPDFLFAATYQDRAIEGTAYRIYSLRSNGFNVAAIAEQYGGGGHNNAAGFKIPIERAGAYGPVADDVKADIEWESPLEEARAKLAQALDLVDKAMEEQESSED